MALTLTEADAQWRAATPYPVAVYKNGYHELMSQADYDAMANDQALMLVAESEAADARAAEIAEITTIVDQVPVLHATAVELESTTGIKPSDLQQYVADLNRLTADMIVVLNKHSRTPQPVPE